jgi:hypothetical protein
VEELQEAKDKTQNELEEKTAAVAVAMEELAATKVSSVL